MSAVVKAVGEVASKASAGWDPIGNWVVNNDVKNAMKVLEPVENISNKIDVLAPIYRKGEELTGSAISKDPVLNWAAETVHDTGMAIDAGLQDIGVNPDSLKMAIAGFFAPYAIPLLQAAMVKAKGGSWGDAVLGAAASYAAQYVGQAAGDWMGSYTSGAPATASQVGQQYGIQAASQQAQQIAAQNAAAMGITDLASNAMVSQLTNAGVSNTVSQLIRTGDVDINKVLDAMKSSGIVSGTSILTSQIPGWNTLPTEVKSAINKTVSGTLQGKDPTALGISVAMDAAIGGVKNYYQDAVSGLTNTYNSAVNKFNEVADYFTSNQTTAEQTYGQLNTIKSQYDTKVAQYDNLVKQYNTSGDASILAQINALRPEIENLQNQYTPLHTTYQNQLGNFNAAQTQLNSVMGEVIDSRRQFYDTAAQAIGPGADMAAYIAANPDVQKEIQETGKSASQIYFERQMANPTLGQTATWLGAISSTSPDKIASIDELYKGATGFDLHAGTGGVDPLTWSVYQEKVEGSAPWFFAEAEKAKQAGDFTKYSKLMGELNKTYSGAYGESLGYGGTDKQGISNQFLGNVLGAVLQQKAQQSGSPVKATSRAWSPTVTPTTDPTKLVRSYGFGNLNPYLSDITTTEAGANKYLRDKYVYDPLAVENRLSNVTTMDFSSQPEGVLSQFKTQLPDAVVSGNRMFLPKGLQQNIADQFGALGTSGYNTLIGNASALDYLKSGAEGGLGSYFKAFSNPYATPIQSGTPTGGLNKVASNWIGSSGVTNPQAQNMLAKNLIS